MRYAIVEPSQNRNATANIQGRNFFMRAPSTFHVQSALFATRVL